MPIKYIGKPVNFKGKSLWEIVGNLKNFGIGRIVVRSLFERYPEPSYLKIMKVETLPNPEFNTPDDMRKVRVWVEKTFRGRRYLEPVIIAGASYKPDYRLIPKDQEAEYCKWDKSSSPQKVMPRTMSLPPLLKELVVREIKAKGEKVIDDPQVEIVYRQSRDSYYRVAEEGEIPNGEFITGFGKTVSPGLYKGLKLEN